MDALVEKAPEEKKIIIIAVSLCLCHVYKQAPMVEKDKMWIFCIPGRLCFL